MPFRPRCRSSITLLALLALAAGCERSTVTPTSFDLVATESAQGRIAFVSNRDGNSEIYVMNADGTGVTRLTDNGAIDQDPTWSADGSRLAFASTRDGNFELYVMNADGSGVTRLTTDPAKDLRPAWCGTRIAFESDRFLQFFPDIYVMNDDGTGVTRLTLSNADFDRNPSWSPSCAQIAFTKDPSGHDQVNVMNADGSGIHSLTSGPGTNSHPAWSPDGARIAFASDRDSPGNSYEIYVMNADGTQQTRVTVNSSFHIYHFPAWSPDGAQIAFQSFATPAPGIYVMNADGSGVTQLADSVSNTRIAWSGSAAPPAPPPPPPPPVPPPPPPPPPAEIHIGDLDGSESNDGSTWTATFEITVHDANHDAVAAGAIVTGVWTLDGVSSSCTTGGSGSSGTCTVSRTGLRKNVGSVSFTVSGVTMTDGAYASAANHDVDGSSDGTSITVNRR